MGLIGKPLKYDNMQIDEMDVVSSYFLTMWVEIRSGSTNFYDYGRKIETLS